MTRGHRPDRRALLLAPIALAAAGAAAWAGAAPAAASPRPSQPRPSQPGPSLPRPSEPGPSLPGPSLPGPSEPGPSEPGPSEPGPSLPRLSLPRPTGPHPVGVHSASVFDPARIDEQTGKPRRLPIRVWYPAVGRGTGRSAAYMSPGVRSLFEGQFGLPAGLLDVDTHATADAPARRSVRGVLLAQHGGGTLASFQTAQVIDLASHGYAVVTTEHPHESYAIEEADGTLIIGPEDADTVPFAVRIADAALMLAHLPRLVLQAGDRTPVGMFGHSRGGAATAETMLGHRRVAAGVIVDGSPRGDVLSAGLDRPLGILLGAEQPIESIEPFLAVLRGPHPVLALPVQHYGFTDWVVLNAQIENAVPGLGVALEQILVTGTATDLDAGRRALADQRRFLSGFFHRYL